METPPISAFAGVILLAAVATSHGQSYESLSGQDSTQIAWASDAFALNLMADGGTTFAESDEPIRFELGAFSEGFDPNTTPKAQWASYWVVLQAAMYDPIEDQVIETATLAGNSAPFTTNSQAYIWGFNTKDVDAGAEWIVIAASEWKFPSADSTLPTTFSVSDADTPAEVLMGSVNGFNGDVFYHMRLEAVVVPEPMTLALLGMAGAGCVCRRRRT